MESDLANRFTGDGLYRANDLQIMRDFFAGVLEINPAFNEFQRADCAPYATRGDGRIDASDVQQMRNYIATLSEPQTAGGPDAPIPGAGPLEERDASATGRAMRIINWSTDGSSVRTPGRAVRAPVIAIEIDSLGDETVILFTLNFDPSKLSNPVVTLADGMPEGITLTSNTRNAADGKVTILLDSSVPLNTNYSTHVVTVTFDIAKGAPIGETPVTFDGSGSMSDSAANSLGAVYTDGSITVEQHSGRYNRRLGAAFLVGSRLVGSLFSGWSLEANHTQTK